MSAFAILCPGQGAQHAQMFALAQTHSVAHRMLLDMDQHGWLGESLTAVLSSDTAMFSNVLAQPLIVAATLANWLALGTALPPPDLIAGYSIGELAAHGVSAALTPEVAIRLAADRARCMQACVNAGMPHRMLAVSGISRAAMSKLLAGSGVHIAIVNGETQMILAGLATDVEALMPLLQAQRVRGLLLTPLPVSIASHTPLMISAAEDFRQHLATSEFLPATTGVLAGVNASKVFSPASARATLLAQLTQVIEWQECMDQLNEAGIRYALELGPGSALSKMLQARHPHIACRSVDDFRSTQGVIDWVHRQAQRD
ncbi:ACP S-malonyltransferase [Undibacterium sp. SXout7W]|uniref:ACP S-malonyltransferase n=1 Tax=Undibacterium sp. SXout7W TaxID=3413049 RepID=UPI003BF0B232